MQIPHRLLSPATLHAIVQEFVTRDGTDYSSIEERIHEVMQQLDDGRVEIYFDEESQSPNILMKNQGAV